MPAARPRLIVQRAQPRPRVAQPMKVKPKKSSKSPDSYDLNRVFSDIANTVTRGLSNPLVLLTVALSIGVIMTHDFSAKKGFIYDTFNNRSDSVSTWIVNHGKKFAGMLMFLPAVVDSPKSIRSVVALASFLWVMVIPEALASEYFIQALALHTYFKLNNNNSRITVLAIVGVAWFAGYIKLGKSS